MLPKRELGHKGAFPSRSLGTSEICNIYQLAVEFAAFDPKKHIISHRKQITENRKQSSKGGSMSLPQRPLGRTGHQATLLGLGGEGILRTYGHEREATEMVHAALDAGIRYFESARALELKDFLHYALSQPVSLVVAGADDAAQVRGLATAARDFTPMPPEAQRVLEAAVAPAAKRLMYYKP